MDSSALVMSCNGGKLEIPWLRRVQECSWFSSIGSGSYSVKNTFLDEPTKDEELCGMRRHHSEPKLPSSFASTEFGEERQLLSFISSGPSSFLSSDRMEGTKDVYEDANANGVMGSVTHMNLSASSADAVGSNDDLSNICHPSSTAAAISTEWAQQEMLRHSCKAIETTRGGIPHGQNECTSERKSSSDSVPGDSHVPKKVSPAGTPPLDELPWDDHVTTVMIRQLPLQCTQAMLMAEITTRGFGNVFDFLYLPYDLKKGENVGYGFINFLGSKYALACRDAFDGTYFPRLARRMPLHVHPAHLQGYEANYNHFVLTKKDKKLTHPRFSPVFLPYDGSSASKMASTGSNRTANPRHAKASSSQKVQRGQEPQSMFCHMCGTKQLHGFRFCVTCGAGLETAVTMSSQN